MYSGTDVEGFSAWNYATTHWLTDGVKHSCGLVAVMVTGVEGSLA
jgi:hypothetical protein